jgi:hypothetical protein
MSVVDRINDETEFKPKRSALCDWCEYNDRCPIYPKERLGNGRVEASSSESNSSAADPVTANPVAADPKVGSAAPDPIARKEGQLHLFAKTPQVDPS